MKLEVSTEQSSPIYRFWRIEMVGCDVMVRYCTAGGMRTWTSLTSYRVAFPGVSLGVLHREPGKRP